MMAAPKAKNLDGVNKHLVKTFIKNATDHIKCCMVFFSNDAGLCALMAAVTFQATLLMLLKALR